MSTNDSVGAQDNGARTEQLRTDIEQTRTDLGDDVAALSEKTNPRARMNRAVGTAGHTVRAHPMPFAAGALALAGATATALLARRRVARARAARKRTAAGQLSTLAGAAATALLARRRADKARTARTRASAGPWFRR
jgi:hypothetical protein